MNKEHEEILIEFDKTKHEISIFMESIAKLMGTHPELTITGHEVIHSYKSRIKDREHLREKISRKIATGREITSQNIFFEITDLAGVRLIHLFQDDFTKIDNIIRERATNDHWFIAERPKAYTWDPEVEAFFKNHDVDVIRKDTSYTSVHYLIRPHSKSPICCEIQVRTLFEEIWGEVDHRINYPNPTESLACKEQIKVLSKITGAGSRLLDSLNRVHKNTTTVTNEPSPEKIETSESSPGLTGDTNSTHFAEPAEHAVIPPTN